MSRNFLLSAVVLVPLLGGGAAVGSWLNSSRPAPVVAPPVSIDPDQLQSTIDVRTLPEQQIADLV